jgi:hypothetical protein
VPAYLRPYDCRVFVAGQWVTDSITTLEQTLDQATDEALALLAINQVEDDVREWHGQEPPF